MYGLVVGRFGVGYQTEADRAFFEAAQDALTDRQLAVLRKMRDEQEELVQEGLEVWVGTERTNDATVKALLLAAVISREGDPDDSYQWYTINGTGKALLAAKHRQLQPAQQRPHGGDDRGGEGDLAG